MGERDFRQQDERLPPAPDCRGDGFEIDLRLAGTCHPVDQRHAETVGCDGLPQQARRLALLPTQCAAAIGEIGRRHDRPRRNHRVVEHALRLQPVDDGGRDAGGMRQARTGPGKPVAGEFEHAGARRRDAVRLQCGALQACDPGFRVERLGRTQDHARHHAGRRQRVGGDPVDESPHRLGHRRAVEDVIDRPQLPGIDGTARTVPDDARDKARPERHPHDRAGPDRHALRHRIGVWRFRRHRHHDGHRARSRILLHDRATLPRLFGQGKVGGHRPCLLPLWEKVAEPSEVR